MHIKKSIYYNWSNKIPKLVIKISNNIDKEISTNLSKIAGNHSDIQPHVAGSNPIQQSCTVILDSG